MSVCFSPLRYPGGKQILTHVLAHLVRLNGAQDGTYVEPYAGGAGAALSLLFGEHVDRVIINDLDRGVFSMWWSILNRTDEFLRLLRDTPINMKHRDRQREIYERPGRCSRVALGFATFYLNRTSRSGIIINGGPIGGRRQTGKWGLDARFNKVDLERKIERITLYKTRIDVFRLDGRKLLRSVVEPLAARTSVFAYLDPPYCVNGGRLYLSYADHDDHRMLRDCLDRAPFPWVLTYDNVPKIRSLYRGFRQITFSLDYRAAGRRSGREVMVVKPGLLIPQAWSRRLPKQYITTQERPLNMPRAVATA